MSIRKIVCLIYPDVLALDVTGPMQVFASANVERVKQGLTPAYELVIVSQSTTPAMTSAGLKICTDCLLSELDLSNVDTLLIPGGEGVPAQVADQTLLAWLRKAEPKVRRLGSVCTGALILAEAGLLDGRMATTHWEDVEALSAYRKVDVRGDRLHTYDSSAQNGDAHIFTSAGVTAGIDLALALVEADLGSTLALNVARRLVMYLKRTGGQAQFSALLAPNINRVSRLATLLEWLPEHLSDDLSLQTLADRACMAPRSLSRAFLNEMGMPPMRYVERVRLEAARTLLESGNASIATVARHCGFGSSENLRRSFHKNLDISPQEYCERFGKSP